MKGESFLHPLPERVLHWLHAFLMAILLISGYAILKRKPIFLTFPELLLLHKIAGVLTGINFLAWVIYEIATGRIKGWIPGGANFLRSLGVQLQWYVYGIFKGDEPPHRPSFQERLNPLQKLVYSIVMLILMPAQIITGLALLLEFGKRSILLPLHIGSFFLLLMFFILHIYLSLSSPPAFSHLSSMITGRFEK